MPDPCFKEQFSVPEDACSSNSNRSNWITEKRLCPTSTSCCVGLTPTELPCWCHDMAAQPQCSMAELRDDFNCARSCLDRKCLWYGRPDLHTGDRSAGKDMTNTEFRLGCQSMDQLRAWWLRSKNAMAHLCFRPTLALTKHEASRRSAAGPDDH